MRKLVRDKIPAKMEAEGIDPKVRVCVGPKLDNLLRRKIVEEALEILEAETPEDLLEEMADLETAFFALRRHHNLTSVDVMCRIQKKSRTHGGFQQGFEIEVPSSDSPWTVVSLTSLQ